MPVKKKKKKGGSKKKGKKLTSSTGKEAGDVPEGDPETMISGDGGSKPSSAKGKKGKKGLKKGKKKLSKAEREMEKLQTACDNIQNNNLLFDAFLVRMQKWIDKNAQKAATLFMRFDVNGDGVLSYEEFKSGLFDLNAPCDPVETHLLCQLLDRDASGTIEYTELSQGLKNLADPGVDEEDDEEDQELEEEEITLTKNNDPLNHCVCCTMALCEPYQEKNPRYVELLLRLITFENLPTHPGHFNQIVHTHIPVNGIVNIIKDHAGIQSTKLAIFTDKSRNKEALLDPSMTLEEYGFKGGTKQRPAELLLYYDYTVEFVDCPLLVCDYYFVDE